MESSNKKNRFNTYEDIKKEYLRISNRKQLEYEKTKELIYEKFPKLKELDFAIIEEYVKEGKASYTNQKYDKKIIDKLKKEREAFLKENNIDNNYLTIKYNCDKCKDTGYIEDKKCTCFLEKEIELFSNLTNFNEIAKTDNFENLKMEYYDQKIFIDDKTNYKDYMNRVLMHIKEQIKNVDKKPYNAIFIGATGTGKTFLARAIGVEFFKRNKSVLYVNVIEYLNSLKPDYNGEPLENYAIACNLLIVDDLGVENITEFTNSKLYYIIDKRINDNKSTIITTNCTPSELKDRYLDSMSSRILSVYSKYYLNGEDLRRIKYADV